MALRLQDKSEVKPVTNAIKPGIENKGIFSTTLGQLYKGDCLEILPHIHSNCIDTVFADPPFNLAKEYGSQVHDNRPEADYVAWCRNWIEHCVRILKPGGAIFLYNLPKWNIILGNYLSDSGLTFRHWIAVNIKLIKTLYRAGKFISGNMTISV